MARHIPFVRDGVLTIRAGTQPERIAVGSAAWQEWLAAERTASFHFSSTDESFTARREHKPGGWYWYAYRRQEGRLRKVYLGRSVDLTLERLLRAATTLIDNRPTTTTSASGPAPDDRPGTSQPQLQTPAPRAGHILTTKLYIPRARPGLVARPRLRARLDAGVLETLTLISAPAGFGKTTLLGDWLRQRPEQSQTTVAWLSLDAEDSDTLRFLRYLIAALQTITPAIGATTLALLQAPQPPAIERLLSVLLNDLAAMPPESILVLDDYHVLQGLASHEALIFLVDHLPPQLHLVIATREDPPLPLARLRARGQLTELRAADLRFTPSEAAAFLQEVMGLPVSPGDVAALEAGTEGWIAGLQLAALAMRDRADVGGFIAAFRGSHSYIVDYLVAEVFERQPAYVQAFLLQTAILDRMCGPLCDAVVSDPWPVVSETRVIPSVSALTTGHRPLATGQALLLELERANLFVVPLDDVRHWYRYHHLFGEVLRFRLQEAEPDRVPVLYQRAAAWYEAHGFVDEALQSALAAGDQERAARLVETHAMPTLQRGDVVTLRGWLARLGETAIRVRPRLALAHAWALIMAGDTAPIAARVDTAEQALARLPDQPADLRSEIAALRGYIALYRGALPQSIVLLQQALATLPEEALAFAGAAYALGDAYYTLGKLAAATEAFTRAVTASRAHGHGVVANVALGGLGNALMLRGRLREAAATAAEGLALAEMEGTHQVTTAANLHLNLGTLHYEWNELETALQHLLRAQEIGKLGEYRILLVAVAEQLAHAHQARGDVQAARVALAEAERLVSGTNDPWRAAMAAAHRVRLDLAAIGSATPRALAAAIRWAEGSGLGLDDPLSPQSEQGHLMLARVLLHRAERRVDGLRLLEGLLVAAEAAGRTHRVIGILALQAVGLAVEGDETAALDALARALTLAAPEGYIRTFVDEGAPMAALLARLASGRSPVAAYAATFLAAFDTGPNGQSGKGTKELDGSSPVPSVPLSPTPLPLVEPLSARELEVLRLMAVGHSNQAIAATLIVAVSTVKKHINNIFGKLEVQNRTLALIRARELNLL